MNILKIFPFIKLEIFNEKPCFIVKAHFLTKALFTMKNHHIKHRVVYGEIELCQEYRTFDFPSPWENPTK